jgi:hypothetical protein
MLIQLLVLEPYLAKYGFLELKVSKKEMLVLLLPGSRGLMVSYPLPAGTELE